MGVFALMLNAQVRNARGGRLIVAKAGRGFSGIS